MPFQVEGRAAQAADYLVAQHICISSGYLETVGAALAAGRTFTLDDRVDTEPVSSSTRASPDAYSRTKTR